MKLYPVLDLMGGVVVRGVAGERQRYRPIRSNLVDSAEPLAVARALRATFGLCELYVADLDAIEGGESHTDVWRALVKDGFQIVVDAGVSSVSDASRILDAGATAVIAALESLPSPRVLGQVVDTVGFRSCVFSLDLRNGTPLGSEEGWSKDIEQVAQAAWDAGARRWIVLDLAAVGIGQGTPHLERIGQWKSRCDSQLEIWTGGGVRGKEDLVALREAGVDGALVASALHDGRLGAADL